MFVKPVVSRMIGTQHWVLHKLVTYLMLSAPPDFDDGYYSVLQVTGNTSLFKLFPHTSTQYLVAVTSFDCELIGGKLTRVGRSMNHESHKHFTETSKYCEDNSN